MTLEEKIAEKLDRFITKIEKIVYRMNLPRLLAIVRKYAEIGDISWIYYVKLIEENVKMYGIKTNISSKVSKIKEIGYKTTVLLELKEARKCAEIGDAFGMELAIEKVMKNAEEYAKKFGEDLSNLYNQIEKIKKIGYRRAIPLELEAARRHAELGDVLDMEISIERAQKYAEKLGVDIFDQVEEIKKIGYRKAIPLKLEAARKSAELGDALRMEECLNFAQKYAEKCGEKIPDQVVAEIYEIYKKQLQSFDD